LSRAPEAGRLGGVNGLSLIAPLFIAFEIWQLVICERYLGIKQIARGANPREMGPGEPIAFIWTAAILVYAAWVLALLASPFGRAHALWLVGASALGYAIRRNCGLKRILIVLTFEGAIRINILFTLSISAWRHL
jgi:hypothetical protein